MTSPRCEENPKHEVVRGEDDRGEGTSRGEGAPRFVKPVISHAECQRDRMDENLPEGPV